MVWKWKFSGEVLTDWSFDLRNEFWLSLHQTPSAPSLVIHLQSLIRWWTTRKVQAHFLGSIHSHDRLLQCCPPSAPLVYFHSLVVSGSHISLLKWAEGCSKSATQSSIQLETEMLVCPSHVHVCSVALVTSDRLRLCGSLPYCPSYSLGLACQAPLSMRFFRQEYWSGSYIPPGDLPNPRIEHKSLMSLELAGGFFTSRTNWDTLCLWEILSEPLWFETQKK